MVSFHQLRNPNRPMTAIVPVGAQIGEVAVADRVRRHRCVASKPEGDWLRIVEQQQGLELPDRRDLVRCQAPLRGVDRPVRLAVPANGPRGVSRLETRAVTPRTSQALPPRSATPSPV